MTDWFTVISDLRKRGMTAQAVADSIESAKSTVLGWKTGAQPKHSDGERLIALWMRMTDQTRDQLPTVKPGDWWSYHSTIAQKSGT